MSATVGGIVEIGTTGGYALTYDPRVAAGNVSSVMRIVNGLDSVALVATISDPARSPTDGG